MKALSFYILLILSHLIGFVFTFWVLFMGGAERLQGAFSSDLFIKYVPVVCTAQGIKCVVVLCFSVDVSVLFLKMIMRRGASDHE